MAAESTPITITEAIKLTSLGIKQQSITFTNVTMESEKYICVRETSPQNSVVIIDMSMPMQPLRLPFAADSAIMNPNTCILALKNQIPGMTRDHLQLLNMEAKTKMKSYQMPEQVVLLKWITPELLGLVTETSVYHWSIEGESAPVKIFDRTANLANNHIINYQCDLTEKWFVLIGIKGSDPERPQLVKGSMQLFSVEHQRSLVKNAYAVAFTTFKVAGNDSLSTLICFASKITYASPISKLHVIELDPQPGMPGFGKKQVDFFFPQDFKDDFPVAIQVSQKYSLIYIITKLGLLFVFDLETAAAICRIRISVEPIFLTTEAMASSGFYSINRKGQVLFTTVNDATIVSFVGDQIKNLELALNLAKRANLPVAINLVLQRFHELLAQKNYKEAAELVAESSQGLLRTPETVAKFQNAPVQAGQTPPLLQYFGTLLTKGKLNVFESLQLSCQLISQNKTNLLENWLDEDKLDCSEELGDIVKTVDNDLALKIYMKARAIQKVVVTFAERSEFDKIFIYFKQLDIIDNFLSPEENAKELALARNELENYKLHRDVFDEIKKEEGERRRLEQRLEAERSEFEKQEKLYHNKLNELRNEASKNSGQLQEVEQKLFDACTQLKETEESLSAETKKRRETEEQLTDYRIELHNLRKSQQQMINEIEELKRQIRNLKEFDPSVECLSSCSNHLEVNFVEFTYAELKAVTDDFHDSFKIGEGGSGSVYKAFLRHTSVAIKILRCENRHREREFNQEVEILSRVKHPNLVMLLGSCPEAQALVYELMPNGSLHDILSNKQRSKTLTWKTRICIASNICSALIFLHSAKPHGIVHGDIKSANILLDSNNISKLSDFGISRQLYQTDTRITPHHSTEYPKGTLPYMDPEYLNSGELTPEYDIFSFGMILLELVTGRGAKGLRKSAVDTLQKGESFVDTSAGKWPIEEAKKMMLLGLRCCNPSRKNRPDLVKEVWVEIESMQHASGR